MNVDWHHIFCVDVNHGKGRVHLAPGDKGWTDEDVGNGLGSELREVGASD